MTESGSNYAPIPAAESASDSRADRSFSKEAIGAATSKLISASIGEKKMATNTIWFRPAVAALIAAISISAGNCLAGESASNSPTTVYPENLKPNLGEEVDPATLSDNELEAQAARLAHGITIKSTDGRTRVLRWSKPLPNFSISYQDARDIGPVSTYRIDGMFKSELARIGGAMGVQAFEQPLSSTKYPDILLSVLPSSGFSKQNDTSENSLNANSENVNSVSVCGNELRSSSACIVKSSIDDTEAILQVQNGEITSSNCTIKYDRLRLCHGQTLLDMSSKGYSLKELCSSWQLFNIPGSRDVYWGREDDRDPVDKLASCFWSSKPYQARTEAVEHWESHWRRQVTLCVLQGLGFVFEPKPAAAPEGRLWPKIRFGDCWFRELCKAPIGWSNDPSAQEAPTTCSTNTEILGAQEALQLAQTMPSGSVTTVPEIAQRLLAMLRKAKSAR